MHRARARKKLFYNLWGWYPVKTINAAVFRTGYLENERSDRPDSFAFLEWVCHYLVALKVT